MDIKILVQAASAVDAPLVAAVVFQGADEPLSPDVRELDDFLGGAFSRARDAGDFRGRAGESLLIHGPSGRRVLFIGGGKTAKADGETLRAIAARAVRGAEELRLTELHLRVPIPGAMSPSRSMQAAVEGLVLAAWDFRELRSLSDDDPPPPRIGSASLAVDSSDGASVPEDDILAEAVRIGRAFAIGTNFARTLQERPGNVATPEHLAAAALQLAEEHDLHPTILGPKEMEKEGMGALLSVAAGSDQEPRLIVLEHRGGGEDEAPLALVGKGLTFDSGGISIKPSLGMEEMKYDMSGGAAVLGAMKAVAMLGLPVNVVGVVPSSENLLNGSANKPGDVVRSRAGKTIEVINTDAEGRLILADALHYAVERFRPRAIVDCATLTGACVIALGHHASAVMGSDDALVQELRDAGDRSGERCWPLPLWEVYRKQIEGRVADLKNVGGRPAGTITAGIFLKEFVKDIPWAHLDIAGTAYGDKTNAPWQRAGAFGAPTRLLLEWVRSRAGEVE